MSDAPERLIERAEDYRGLAAHLREQHDEPEARRVEAVEVWLREVAEALGGQAEEGKEEAA